MKNLKNIVSNVAGILILIGGIAAEIEGQIPEGAGWKIWLAVGGGVVISYLTGKGGDGKKIK